MQRNNIPLQYSKELSELNKRLFDLYEKRDIRLVRKEKPKGLGHVWGFRVEHEGEGKFSGASIALDEVKLLYDLSNIINAKRSYIIGNSFGFSTFALALSKPDNHVVAIDNWSEGSLILKAKELSEDITKEFKNVTIFTGTSPQDTQRAIQGKKQDLVFIDGLHTDEQVYLDYKGVHDYLTIDSVVIFHNAMYLFNGIKDAFKYRAWENFDTFKMLKTFGNTAIFYDSDTWPEITDYLKANSLVWEDWKKYARYLENLDVIDKYFKLKQKPYYNFLLKLLRLRNGHRG